MTVVTLSDRIKRLNAQGKIICPALDVDAAGIPVEHLGLGHNLGETQRAQAAYIKLRDVLLSTDPPNIQTLRSLRLSSRHRWLLSRAQFVFAKRIVRAVTPHVVAIKTNSAFPEALGSEGMWARDHMLEFVATHASGVENILDFKRGDIGNSNVGYVMSAVSAKVDSVTWHPYMGQESLQLLLKLREMGVFVLVRTSNLGADELQDPKVPFGYHSDTGEAKTAPMYQFVASRVARGWNRNGNCGVVAGATWPEEIAAIRGVIDQDMTILIPGAGAQGGPFEKALLAGANTEGQGVIMVDGRKTVFASKEADFDQAAEARVLQLTDVGNAALAAA